MTNSNKKHIHSIIPRGMRIHSRIALILAAILIAAVAFLFSKFNLTGASRSAFLPFETLAPEVDEQPSSAPASEEPASSETPDIDATPSIEPTPTPDIDYKKTSVFIDGNKSVTLASRQAAEELISSAVHHFELLCPGSSMITEVENKVEFKNADDDEETTSFDNAFALFTGENSPLRVRVEFARNDFETIPHDTKTENSPLYYAGTRFISSYGRDGKKLQLREYTYLNGVLEKLTVSGEVVLCEPANETVIVGTRSVPSGTPASDFAYTDCIQTNLKFTAPVDGSVKKFFGFYNGERHRGVDYECAPGADCIASCAGTVIAVLSRGNMGMTIDIDHGSGFISRCAMLESTSVSVGDSVSAGDTIGKAGENGVHFEIIVNGLARNPLYYAPRPAN